MAHWYDDDGFWDALAPFFFEAFRTPEVTAREVEHILALADPPDRGTVLDLACGPGRHAVELARRGYRVTGVDRTASYLATARTRAREMQVTVDLVQEDMRRFTRPGAFDVALCLFSSFGYFEDPDDDRRVLRNVRASLAPGGRLLIDVVGREILTREYHPRDWHAHPSRDEYLLEERSLRPDGRWIDNHWILIRGSERHAFEFGLRIYAGDELRAALVDTGFSRVTLFGGFDGTPYDERAERLVALAAV